MKKFRKKIIRVNNKMQKNYNLVLTEPIGKNFDPEFRPDLTPAEMLEIGVFSGVYFGDYPSEYPKSWWKKAKISPDHKRHPELNYYGVNASLSLKEWQKRGWIYKEDPRGWFEWYCRYYLGRRCPDDSRQIRRFKAMKRHIAQLVKNCRRGDKFCRPVQRQALLHWAYDSRKF